MKKIKIFSVLVMLSMLFLINGCAKKEKNVLGNDCSTLSTAYSNAVTAWTANQNQQTCTNMYNALKDYVDGCSILTPAQRQSFNDMLNLENCSGL